MDGNVTTIVPDIKPTFPYELRITTWQDPPYSVFEQVNGSYVGGGYAFNILNMLKTRFNFTYTLIPPKEQILGTENSGIVEMLVKKEVDMAVAFLPVMNKVRNLINYSVSLDELEMTFVLRRPPGSSSGAGLFAPYTPEVWYSIIIAVCIVGPSAWLTINLRHFYKKDNEMWRYTFPRCMWFAYGALLKQGTTKPPAGDSTRLVFASWWIFVTIFSSFYTANMTAFLTLSYYTLGINTINDVANGYNWFAMKGRSVQSAIEDNVAEFQEMKRMAEKRYGEFITDYGLSEEDLLKRIRRTGRGFMTDMQLARSMIWNDFRNKSHRGIPEPKRCMYILAPKPLYMMETAFAFPINSPIYKEINKELFHIVENGLVKHMKKESIPAVSFCPPNLPTKEKRLRVADLMQLFTILGYSYSAAGVLFLLEGICYLFIRCCCGKDSCCNCFKQKIVSTDSLPAYSPPATPQYSFQRSPPPFYQAVQDHRDAKKYNINGRDYYIIKGNSGNTRLIPIRVPSAYLFHQFAA